jgi:Zn-dependent metalloprotease
MLLKNRIQSIQITIILIVLTCSSKGLAAASHNAAVSGRRTALKNLINSTSGIPKEPARIFKTNDGYLRFVGAAPSTHFVAKAGTLEDSAEDFLGKWRNLFVNESAEVRFERKRVNTRNGRTYVRYRQRYARLEVFGGEIIVQVSATGGIEAVISDIMRDTSAFDTQRLSITAVVDPESARRNATTFLAERYAKLSFGSGEPNLMIYAPDVLGRNSEPQLVWKTQVANIGEPLVKEIILVDAHNGEVAFHYSLIYSALTRQIYDYVTQEWYNDQSNWPTDIGEVNLTYDYVRFSHLLCGEKPIGNRFN